MEHVPTTTERKAAILVWNTVTYLDNCKILHEQTTVKATEAQNINISENTDSTLVASSSHVMKQTATEQWKISKIIAQKYSRVVNWLCSISASIDMWVESEYYVF